MRWRAPCKRTSAFSSSRDTILLLRREVGVQDPHQSVGGHDLDQVGALFDVPFDFEKPVDRLLLAILEVVPSVPPADRSTARRPAA